MQTGQRGQEEEMDVQSGRLVRALSEPCSMIGTSAPQQTSDTPSPPTIVHVHQALFCHYL